MASTVAQYQTIIDTIDTAITSICENGQSVSFDGVTYTKANIGELISARKKYEAEMDLLSTTTKRSCTFVRGRMLT